MFKAAERLKDALRSLVNPITLFEELGFEYFGPIDGHDIEKLIETFEAVKKLEGPILVHVVTRKGKGYIPAEEKPHLFHSASPFDKETGNFIKKNGVPSYTQFFSDFLVQQARRDERIVAITAAMTEGTGLVAFSQEFADRFYDVGIAEQHAVTFAAGLAVKGFKPVVAVYSTFLQRAFDQVAHDVCLQNLHVIFAMDRAGIVGADGPTHNGIYDFSYLRLLPNITLMVPRDENELGKVLATALEHNGPVGFRYPRGRAVGLMCDSDYSPIPVGKGELLKDGADVAFLALGATVYPAVEAADMLEKEGIHAAVFDARFLKPLDRKQILRLARKCGKLVTIEENVLPGGFGSAVLELLEQEGMAKVQVRRIGVPDQIIEHGSQQIIRHQLGLDTEGIYKTTRRFLAPTHRLRAVKA
jgi:1-deoxy-D-xylulose-5-phosphate synthase